MKKFLKSKLGKYILYTLLCVCVFVGIWAIVGWMLYDFNYLINIPSRVGMFIQFIGSSLISIILIIKLDFEIEYW